MLTIRETQDQTGLSDAAIRRHIKSGNINATQTADGKYLIEESELTKLPNPRNRLPHQKVEKEGFTQDVPFSLDPRREEMVQKVLDNERIALENQQTTLELMRQNREMLQAIQPLPLFVGA